MTKVWMVTSGEYSDYAVRGIFSTKENAEIFKGLWDTDEKYYKADIWEIELDQHIDRLKAGELPYSVWMILFSGDNASASSLGPGSGHREGYHNVSVRNWTQWYHTIVWAKDDQAAIKIANEKRIQYLARPDSQEVL